MCIGQEGPRVEVKCRFKGTRAGRGRVSKIAAAVFGLVISWPDRGLQEHFQELREYREGEVLRAIPRML
jgi:hypothetical protein